MVFELCVGPIGRCPVVGLFAGFVVVRYPVVFALTNRSTGREKGPASRYRGNVCWRAG